MNVIFMEDFDGVSLMNRSQEISQFGNLLNIFPVVGCTNPSELQPDNSISPWIMQACSRVTVNIKVELKRHVQTFHPK